MNAKKHPGLGTPGADADRSCSGQNRSRPNTKSRTSAISPREIDGSNSLADLAARIRAEHEAASLSLKQNVEHAMAAGALLIEAKAQLKHGQWLPWLRDRCAMSERTAQLYMRVARNRAAIEAKAQCVADLTLNEAAAILVLTSDVQAILDFAKRAEAITDPEQLVKVCIAEGVGVIHASDCDPFVAGGLFGRERACTDAEKRDWYLFALLIGGGSAAALHHVEWLLRNGWNAVAEWLSEEGDKFRARCGMRAMPQKVRDEWAAFLKTNDGRTIADITAELDAGDASGDGKGGAR